MNIWRLVEVVWKSRSLVGQPKRTLIMAISVNTPGERDWDQEGESMTG